jgi:epoxide hydrolase 4
VLAIQFDHLTRLGSTHTNESSAAGKHIDFTCELARAMNDVQAVIHHLKRDKAIIIGHDWGGAIAWIFAIGLPALTERLIILNCPHPTGIIHELAHNTQQQEHSAYARDFQKEDAHKRLTPESLSAWVKDSAARERYLEAFRRSDFEAMLHYYKQNYPPC